MVEDSEINARPILSGIYLEKVFIDDILLVYRGTEGVSLVVALVQGNPRMAAHVG